MNVLTNLKARGVQDILITCTDNLNGWKVSLMPYFHGEITGIIRLFSSSFHWKSENNLYYKSH